MSHETARSATCAANNPNGASQSPPSTAWKCRENDRYSTAMIVPVYLRLAKNARIDSCVVTRQTIAPPVIRRWIARIPLQAPISL
jgi:hypothetical protein